MVRFLKNCLPKLLRCTEISLNPHVYVQCYFTKCLNYLSCICNFENCHSSLIPEMTDCEETFLSTAITEVLPDLPEVSKDILEETLQNLGVETYDDFQFVEEVDLLSALRLVQARKVLAAWKLRCKTSITVKDCTFA